MKQFLKDFFSTSNEINENVVIGCVFVAIFILSGLFIESDKLYVIAGLIVSFFGLGVLKK